MSDHERVDTQELAFLVKRLDRQRRARLAAEAISDQATRALYDQQVHLGLLQAIAVAANESFTFRDAVQTALDEICTRGNWAAGHVYLTVGRTDILALSDIWYLSDLARFEGLRAAIEQAPAPGLALRALAEKRPLWGHGFQSESRHVAEVADTMLQTILAFPIVVNDQVLAVVELFSESLVVPDADYLDVLMRISRLLWKVHERTQGEVSLRSSEEQYRILFEGNPNPMWICDAQSAAFLGVNDAAVQQYGYSRDELMGMRVDDIRPAEEGPFSAPERNERSRLHIRRKDGRVITVEISARDLRLPGRMARVVMAVDADEGKRTEQELRESERRFRDLLDNVQMAAVLLDVVGIVTYCNPYLLTLTGYEKRDVIGANWYDLFAPPEKRETASRAFFENMRRGTIPAHEESEIVTRRSERRSIAWSNTVLRNSEGSTLGTASIGIDVTDQKRAEAQLLHDAFHDSLTGLPNRALFLDRASQALGRYRRHPWNAFAVLLLDVDRFKNVNDTLGHVSGDEILVMLGHRVSRSVRAGDTVARFGGDEFAVLIENIADVAEATRTAQRILKEIAMPFEIDGEEMFLTASAGITIAGPEHEGAEQLLRDADVAMYRAKSEGKARYEMFDARMRAEAVARMEIERDLRRAIDRGELRVYYQPIVDLATGLTAGFEALVRWQHPTRGLVSPAQFIPIAEETGLIVEVGEYVIAEACRQTARLQRDGKPPVSMSINISSRQFSEVDLVAHLRGVLRDTSVNGKHVHLEITESVIMQHSDTAFEMMEELRGLGMKIAVDDFGTGYSSLSYLHRFPIDQLKIDSSFVKNLGDDRKNVEIIRSIIDLGRNVGMDVIAEGIETPRQLEDLRILQCGYGQGYLFARPMEPEAALQFEMQAG